MLVCTCTQPHIFLLFFIRIKRRSAAITITTARVNSRTARADADRGHLWSSPSFVQQVMYLPIAYVGNALMNFSRVYNILRDQCNIYSDKCVEKERSDLFVKANLRAQLYSVQLYSCVFFIIISFPSISHNERYDEQSAIVCPFDLIKIIHVPEINYYSSRHSCTTILLFFITRLHPYVIFIIRSSRQGIRSKSQVHAQLRKWQPALAVGGSREIVATVLGGQSSNFVQTLLAPHSCAFLFSFFLFCVLLGSCHEETVLAIIGACRHRVLVIHATHFRLQHSVISRDPGPVQPVVEFAEHGREISSEAILSEPCSFTLIRRATLCTSGAHFIQSLVNCTTKIKNGSVHGLLYFFCNSGSSFSEDEKIVKLKL
ncbi:hypothetical protein ALC56_03679 [Trachymyrmex septentrionalis]|uniref:Uncharacterized protein n=1 Tax=Trachymyrmex septentrionalis TaxID=34720 RepID=A0A151K044_9HYME|nr:hypothetical protein ALC56_03679 [Trachymyrmex septentrionalis]